MLKTLHNIEKILLIFHNTRDIMKSEKKPSEL